MINDVTLKQIAAVLLHVDLVREIPEAMNSGNPDRELQQGFGGSADQGRCLML
jgi:hypothetical protein